jgi:hypothetical protein
MLGESAQLVVDVAKRAGMAAESTVTAGAVVAAALRT